MKEYLIPTKRIGYILGGILIIILIISFLSFPLGSFMSINPSASVKFNIGWPVVFFSLDLMNPESMPINWIPLILSFLAYIIIAYIIDVIISLIFIGLEKPDTPDETFTKARKAYFYYRSQGLEEIKVRELFKQKGWKDEDIKKLKE